ncbi:MAG: Hpt domain-containing protein [bacterium]|nr:Hpt domain-containing protein [bacterium]
MKQEIIDINIQEGIANCGGSEELYKTVLESIVLYVPQRLDHLLACLEQKEYKEYIIEAHTLKSNAALIGAVGIASQAKELEYAGKSGEYKVLHKKTSILIAQFENVLEQIKKPDFC